MDTKSNVANYNKNSSALSFIKRVLTDPLNPNYIGDKIEEKKLFTAHIDGRDGPVYHQENVEAPVYFSQNAVNIIASKYFYGDLEKGERESSVYDLVHRVVNTIKTFGIKNGYFNDEQAIIFYDELRAAILGQYGTFNSPTWFNVGIKENPGISACFLATPEDTIDSIYELVTTEANIFRTGAGNGTNLSKLRGSMEKITGGGLASGPLSFMKILDVNARIIKSGGVSRRAALLRVLNDDHPDLVEFIKCKSIEEKKADTLIASGKYDNRFDGEAYSSIFFQNSNNSVKVTDKFMNAVLNDEDWHLTARTDGAVIATYKAKDLFRLMAQEAWETGCPGIMFHDTLQDWHTVPKSGPINTANPCIEVNHIDNVSCNLASFNLMKFLKDDNIFDYDLFHHIISIFVLAMEIEVSFGGFPSEKIKQTTITHRPLGIGISNLGSLLMSLGIPYDSKDACALASYITSYMTAVGYITSGLIASVVGPFEEYKKNKTDMLRIINKHLERTIDIIGNNTVSYLWEEAYEYGEKYGFRNSQISVTAPTGTISFMMDCSTTGCEPVLSLVAYKKLVGGGTLKIVNNDVERGLRFLGYSDSAISKILEHILEHGSLDGCALLMNKDLKIFDTSLPAGPTKRCIHWRGHLNMVAAIQPFISGSSSKTFNLPNDATIETVEKIYLESWKQGIKSVSIYRDGCRKSQPLTTFNDDIKKNTVENTNISTNRERVKLPDTRKSITHKFEISGHEGYLTIGLYGNGTPGEIFIEMAKTGSTINGLMDSFAQSISLLLQYGVPLDTLIEKFTHTRFEPSGFTKNKDVPIAKSIVDYIFRYMKNAFINQDSKTEKEFVGIVLENNYNSNIEPSKNSDAPICIECGAITRRNGTCYLCEECGATTGCS